jgi:hypothetical protein
MNFNQTFRFDSWKNLLTSLGFAHDKGVYTHFSQDNELLPEYLEELFTNDDIAARICELDFGLK